MRVSGMTEGKTPDWTDNVPAEDFEQTLRDEGFYKVLDDQFPHSAKFKNMHGGQPLPTEHFCVYFRPVEGLIVTFETFCGWKINTSLLHYNWVEESLNRKQPYYHYYHNLHGSGSSYKDPETGTLVGCWSSSLPQQRWG